MTDIVSADRVVHLNEICQFSRVFLLALLIVVTSCSRTAKESDDFQICKAVCAELIRLAQTESGASDLFFLNGEADLDKLLQVDFGIRLLSRTNALTINGESVHMATGEPGTMLYIGSIFQSNSTATANGALRVGDYTEIFDWELHRTNDSWRVLRMLGKFGVD